MKSPYVITGAAVLSIIFLAVGYVAWQAARLNTNFLGETVGPQVPQQSASFTFDDPFITVVPDEQQLPSQKSKVFVSSEDPILGDSNAKVFIIFYGSLLDNTMQTYLSNVDKLQDELGDDVAIVWKDSTQNETAIQAATVGHCANTVGHFWDYAKRMNEVTGATLEEFRKLAVASGTNSGELDSCLKSTGYSAQIAQSTALAANLNASNEHTVFVNDQAYNQAVSTDTLIAAAKDVLAE